MSNVTTAAVQLQRERHHNSGLEEELRDIKEKMRSHDDKYRNEKHRWASHTQTQSTSITDLRSTVTTLSLEKNSLTKEVASCRKANADLRKAFEGQLKKYGRVSQTTITRAEDQLTAYNEEWSNRIIQERLGWAESLKEKEEEHENQLRLLHARGNEAQQYYYNQMEKLKGEIMHEERQRREISELLEELKHDLSREKSARKVSGIATSEAIRSDNIVALLLMTFVS